MPRLRWFTLMQGDRLPEIVFTVTDQSGIPIDLTDAGSVKFLMASLPNDGTDSVNKIDAAAIFVDKPNGVVKYSWDTDDTDTSGRFAAVFEIVDGAGKRFSVPNDDYLYVQILARLQVEEP